MTALLAACRPGGEAVVRQLLDRGANVNVVAKVTKSTQPTVGRTAGRR